MALLVSLVLSYIKGLVPVLLDFKELLDLKNNKLNIIS